MIALASPPKAVAGAPTPAPSKARTIKELSSSISASRLSTWQQCRLKFYFRYVLALTKPKTAALHVGSVIHAVLQQWNLARWRKITLDETALKEIFEQSWGAQEEGEAVDWEGEEEGEKATAWNTLAAYLRDTPIPPDEKPEGVEVSVEADLNTAGLPKLVGVLDLVRAGGRIVDFKTSARTPDPAQSAHLHEGQATIYSLLYRAATGHEEQGVELHCLIKTKTPKVIVTELGPATDAQRTRLLRIIESHLIGLAREDFVPSPGLTCTSCQFFKECRVWH